MQNPTNPNTARDFFLAGFSAPPRWPALGLVRPSTTARLDGAVTFTRGKVAGPACAGSKLFNQGFLLDFFLVCRNLRNAAKRSNSSPFDPTGGPKPGPKKARAGAPIWALFGASFGTIAGIWPWGERNMTLNANRMEYPPGDITPRYTQTTIWTKAINFI